MKKNINLQEYVYNYPTKHKEGFTDKELKELFKAFPSVNMDKANNAMNGNTCMVIDDEIINYHCDVLAALRCGLENRDLKWYEWD